MVSQPDASPHTTIQQTDVNVRRDHITAGRDHVSIRQLNVYYDTSPGQDPRLPRSSHLKSLDSRVVAVASVELSNMEDVAEKAGNARRTQEALQPFLRLVDRFSSKFGGTRQPTTGYTYVLTFSQPSGALKFALALQQECYRSTKADTSPEYLRPKIGIDVGEVLFTKERVGNLAGRHVLCSQTLMAHADPDQILVSRIAYEASKDLLDLEPEKLKWESFGAYWAKNYGPLDLMEVTDPSVRAPATPTSTHSERSVSLRPLSVYCPGFQVEERLGEGAISVAYMIRREVDSKPFVAKFLAYGLDGIDVFRDYFSAAAHVTGQLRSSNVARVTQVVPTANLIYAIREYFEGQPVTSALEGVDAKEVAGAFASICETLDECHSEGLIHGNLKPNNILVDKDKRHCLTDFGLRPPSAREDTSSSLPSTVPFGSPLYLSPEQSLGNQSISAETDIYAIGAILYEVLAGRPLFPLSSLYEVLNAHIFDPPDLQPLLDVKVPRDLQSICLKAIEKDTIDRYSSAEEMAEDLHRFKDGKKTKARPTVYQNLISSRARRHVQELTLWCDRNLISKDELAALCDAYEDLTARGVSASLDSRFIDKKAAILLLGGVFALTSASILVQHFVDSLRDYLLITVTLFIALLTNTAWIYMWKAGLARGAHALMPIGVYTIPSFVLVFLHHFDILAFSLGRPSIGESTLTVKWVGTITFPFSNTQYIVASTFALFTSIYTMIISHSPRMSVHTAIVFVIIYFLFIDFHNVPDLALNHPLLFSLACVPLILISLGTGKLLLANKEREIQSPAWLSVALLTILWVTFSVAANLPELYRAQLGASITNELKAGSLVVCGLLYTAIGLWWRNRWPGPTIVLHCVLLIVGPSTSLIGLAFAHTYWPATWPTVPLLGGNIGLAILAALILSVGLVALAPVFRTRCFAVVGSLGTGATLWWIAAQELDAKLGIVIGAFAVGSALLSFYIYKELQDAK